MLESFNTDKFDYQKLSLEEQQKRGILGRLTGVIADTVNPTRNGRKYSASLWEGVFDDPLMQEKIQNRCLFGELGHPADREETDMEKIALCLAEKPKKGKDGKIYGVFDILDTPNGRILKTLCDYGCNIGVSSRGSGDLVTDYDGNESVDPDTYDCQGWDAVLVPAVKEARMQYVTEALNTKKYNKTLKVKLQESLNKASEDDRKVMKESLTTLGVKLNEDDLHPVFRKDAKNQYKSFTANKDAYDKKAAEVENELKDLGADEEKIDKYKDTLLGKAPEFKLIKGHNNLERQNYPFYITAYEGTSYYHPEEGGYYQPGLEPYYSEGYQTFEEAQEALQKYLEENSSVTVSFNPSNVAVNDDNYSYSESEEEYRPIYDNKNRLIGAIASGKYIGEEEQVWIEPSKHYLSRKVGYEVYESLNESTDEISNLRNRLVEINKAIEQGDDPERWSKLKERIFNKLDELKADYYNESLSEDISKETIQDAIDYYKENAFGYDGLRDYVETDFSHWPESMRKEMYKKLKKVLGENLNINEAQSTAVDNNEAMVEELQSSLKEVKELKDKLVSLQERLSVSYAKESKLEEQVEKQKSAITNLTSISKKASALERKVKSLQESKNSLEVRLKNSSIAIKKLTESANSNIEKRKQLLEQVSNKEKSNKILEEELTKVKQHNSLLKESIETLKKDFELKKSDYSRNIEKSNQLVEKYKRIAAKSVDKYIESQAVRLGIDSNEIKNKLPESYTFKDIDAACESARQYKTNLNKLPFNILKENVQVKATPSKNDNLANLSKFDDDVDNQLLQWARIN